MLLRALQLPTGSAGQVQAVPRWSRNTLERHAGDPRPLMSLAQLEAGATGDALWDAMQQQLVLTGEPSVLHSCTPRLRHGEGLTLHGLSEIS